MLIHEICVVELWIEMNVYHRGGFLTVLRQEHPDLNCSWPSRHHLSIVLTKTATVIHIHDFFFIVDSNIPNELELGVESFEEIKDKEQIREQEKN